MAGQCKYIAQAVWWYLIELLCQTASFICEHLRYGVWLLSKTNILESFGKSIYVERI